MKLRKAIILIVFLFLAMAITSVMSTVKAATGNMQLNIKMLRRDGYGYQIANGQKNVWKIYKTSNSQYETIYCLKGGPGFGSSDFATATPRATTYGTYFDLKDPNSIPSTYRNALPTIGSDAYEALLWILDNSYVLPKDNASTQERTEAEEQKQILLDAATDYAIETGNPDISSDGYEFELLTDDDIDATQQLAIWYYTNPSGDYHVNTFEFWLNAIQGTDGSYTPLSDDWTFIDGWERMYACQALFYYLVETPQQPGFSYDYQNSNLTTSPVNIANTTPTITTQGSRIIVGPYRINETRNIEYALEGTFLDGNNREITDVILLNSSQQQVSRGTTLKDLVGQNFYISIPVTTNTNTITFNIEGFFFTTITQYWSVTNPGSTDQPVVLLEKDKVPFEDSKIIENTPKPPPEEEFDLALRKFITSVKNANNSNVPLSESREPQIANSELDRLENKTTTTANKVHTKDPVLVQKGYKVTYTIRIYNEGDLDGYATEITDHLPDGLTFITDSAINERYEWVASGDGKTITTNYLQNTRLDAFDGTNLDYVDIQIECEVTADVTINNQTLKNIAEITGHRDQNGNTAVNDTDRDSQPGNVNLDIYTNTSQQDDDDFEDLILPAATMGSYNIQLIKVDSSNESTRLAGAVFRVRLPNGSTQTLTTNSQGLISLGPIDITSVGTDVITIEEINAPEGYEKLFNSVEVTVTKALNSSNQYIATRVEITSVEGTNILNREEVEVALSGNVVTVTVPNKKQEIPTGDYQLQLIKVDSSNENTRLEGAEFRVRLPNGSNQTLTTNSQGLINLGTIEITSAGTDVITIEEINAPEGYEKLFNSIEITVTKELTTATQYSATGVEITNVEGTSIVNGEEVKVALSGNVVTVTVPNKKIIPTGDYQLQLIKVDSTNESTRLAGAEFRVTLPDGSSQTLTTNNQGLIDLGTIDITSAGTDVITIEEINAPEGYEKLFNSIEITVTKELTTTTQYSATGVEITNVEGTSIVNGEEVKVALSGNVVTVTVPNKKVIPTGDYQLQLIKVDSSNENTRLEGAEFRVTLPDGSSQTLTTNSQGLIDLGTIDITSVGTDVITIEEINAPEGYDKLFNSIEITVTKELTTATQYNATEVEITNVEGTSIVNGEQVKVALSGNVVTVTVPNKLIKNFDLALRKFIIAVNEKELKDTDGTYTREPVVDTTPLLQGQTTAIYNHPKIPIGVFEGDIVTYTIRVYNEGQADGYVTEITDHLPEQLEYIVDDELNARYGWQISADGRTVTTDITSPTTNLSASRDEIYANRTTDTDKVLLKAFDNGEDLDYIDVQIRCRVKTGIDLYQKITNIAEISDFTDSEGSTVEDIDSQKADEDNIEIPSDEELPTYKDPEIESGAEYIPGEQDDDDFEKLVLQKFDLALRKFITGVSNNENAEINEITNRVPVFNITEDGNYEYIHPKDPVEVANGNIVIYTLRIFNEGNVAGYATEVKDDLPEGLEFLPNHEINNTYRWVMYREDGTQTTDVSEASYIKTDYLSKEQEQNEGDNLIDAFNPETMTMPDYKDIQIAFRVTEPNTSDRIIINTAEITEDSDENGNPVEDVDSTPDNNVDGEDDIDIEKVKVLYFDLSLKKWVTESIVTYNGQTTVTQTGNTENDDPETPAKVEIRGSRISRTTVKFRFNIKVTNEGEIAGYATEIIDYVPEGLEFHAEDNPLWREEDGKILTDQLKDTLLQPGESATIDIVLTWINSTDNLGEKINWAEIYEDDNEYDSPDIDSTPGNNVHGEDDIDEAPVILAVVTGSAPTYITLVLASASMIAGGIFLIKKFVI